jgi:hypothetical protein
VIAVLADPSVIPGHTGCEGEVSPELQFCK